MKILLLEDSSDRVRSILPIFKGHEIFWEKTAWDAIARLFIEKIDVAFLDHDLGSAECGTGMDVAQFIVDCDLMFPVVIHSMSDGGATNMRRYLEGYGHSVILCPGFWLDKRQRGDVMRQLVLQKGDDV